MEGGMMQNTVKHLKRIVIETMAKELKKIGVKEEVIEEVTNNAKKEIQNY